MVPDVEERVPSLPPADTIPIPEKADTGPSLSEQESDTAPPEKAGTPWGVILGAAALALAAVGVGLNLMGPSDPEPPQDPVVQEEPTLTDPVELPAVEPVTAPLVTEPVVTEPVVTEPLITAPVAKDPVVKDPIKPVVKDPVTPVVKDPVKDPPRETVVVSSGLSHKKPSSAKVGTPITLQASAPSGDYTVTLYFRATGTGSKFTARTMRGSGNSFSAQVTPDASFAGGLEYYIQAKPTAGGELLKKGSGFSPLKVPVR